MTHILRTTGVIGLAAWALWKFLYPCYVKMDASGGILTRPKLYSRSLQEESEYLEKRALPSGGERRSCKGYISCRGTNLFYYGDGLFTNQPIRESDRSVLLKEN